MGKALIAALALLQMAGSLSAAQASTLRVKPPFQPPEVLSVTDFAYPSFSVASGTVVLDVLIDETGNIKDIELRRNIASLTPVVLGAVKGWKFSPATFAGKAVTSRMTVAVNFRPPAILAAPVPLPPLLPQTEGRIQQSFEPAEVTSATFPTYPSNAFAPGTVIVEVTLNETGKPLGSKVLRDFPPLTAAALQAVERWKFMAATLNGRPVQSKVVLVFVFSAPMTRS